MCYNAKFKCAIIGILSMIACAYFSLPSRRHCLKSHSTTNLNTYKLIRWQSKDPTFCQPLINLPLINLTCITAVGPFSGAPRFLETTKGSVLMFFLTSNLINLLKWPKKRSFLRSPLLLQF